MSGGLLLFVSAIYVWVAVDQWRLGNTGIGVAFFGYAISNLGMYATAIK